jgi:hypothetical protein
MITKQDVYFLFEVLWPRMNRAGLHKQRCLAQFDQINERFEKYQSDFNQLLVKLKEVKYIGWVIASGLIFSANRATMVPFDSNTTGWAIEKRIIPNNRISTNNYVNYSNKIVDYIRNSPPLSNIIDFVREASQTIKRIAPE